MFVIKSNYKRESGSRRMHKYVKRTGGPGSYKYWYKLPDGSLGTKSDEHQQQGKRDHARRLAVSHLKGQKTLGTKAKAIQEEIARRTGLDRAGSAGVQNIWRNLHKKKANGRRAHEDHGYEDEHLAELASATSDENPEGSTVHEPGSATEETTTSRPAGRAPVRTVSREEESAMSENAASGAAARGDSADDRDLPSHKRLRAAGFSAAEIENVTDGFQVGDIEGEVQNERVGGLDGQNESSHAGTVDSIIANKKNGMFEAGFKYPQLGEDGDDHNKWMEANGFSRISGEDNAWINGDKVVISATGASGGYMGIHGPDAKTKEVMNKMLGDMTYLKDLSAYQNGLGGGPENQEQYDSWAGAAPARASKKKVTKKKVSKKKVTKKVAKVTKKKVSKKKTSKKITKDNVSEASDEDLMALLSEGGMDLNEGSEAAASVKRIEEARASLVEAEPVVAEVETEIEAATETHESGGNPYLDGAKANWDRYKSAFMSSAKPSHVKHADKMSYFTQTLDAFGGDLSGVSKAQFKQKMKETTGSGAVSDVDKALETVTGYSLDEILNNSPVDADVERMKRGYAKKQYDRLEPFIKDSWKQGNTDAPPPYPTWGDLNTWGAHDGEKPSWAGSTRTAVPKEVFDASASEGGKPKYPPAWMPIHLMPLWNHIVKSQGSQNAYAGGAPGEGQSVQGNVSVGDLSAQGMVMSSIRKYVQSRGGPEGLIDIPSSKLRGSTHEELFRSMDLGDHALIELTQRKHFPLEDLVANVNDELNGDKKEVKKSNPGSGSKPKYFIKSTDNMTIEELQQREHEIHEYEKKQTYVISKSARGTHWKKNGNFVGAGGAVITPERRQLLAKQKAAYDAKKEGKSDTYYTTAMNRGTSLEKKPDEKKKEAPAKRNSFSGASGKENGPNSKYFKDIGALKRDNDKSKDRLRSEPSGV